MSVFLGFKSGFTKILKGFNDLLILKGFNDLLFLAFLL
ncbi:hypothetical protein HPHPA20_1013 [Helicobacter pylori Hp A-20]|nr:hypothetical protein HPHPA20_1013 [Helicobacter pylori Hp A-20]